MRVEANSVNAFRPAHGSNLTAFGFRVYAVLGYEHDVHCSSAEMAGLLRTLSLVKDVVEKIAHAAHQICPYSKSVRGNIEVTTNIVTV
jgi:hypothetical protein